MKHLPTGKEPSLQPLWQTDPLVLNPGMISNEEWYTTHDVMKLFNISRSSVYRLRVRKQLPAFKLGGTIVFPKTLINQLLLVKATQDFVMPTQPEQD